MSEMNNGTNLTATITLSKQTGTTVTFDTDKKYVEKDMVLTLNVQGGSATTPATTITANPTISVNSATGLITATASGSKSVTPTVSAGWVGSGTAGTITVNGSNTSQLTTQAAQTITPGTTNQTISAGKYLTGTQTIAGDANLVAGNIADGVTIFGVTGTHSGGSDPDLIPANIKTGVDILGVVGTYGGGPSSGSINIDQNGYYDVTNYASASINVTSGGSAQKLANGVNFYDYDGTVLYSYSVSEFANLSAMPANPSHAGLTAQGWNWTLAKAKTYVAKYGRLEIGQMYITNDGKTRVYIHLEQGRTSPMLGVCPKGTVDVDWGDGTAHDTLTGTSTSTVKWTPNHAYAAPGDYVIKLTVTGSIEFYGYNSGNQYSGLLRCTSSADTRNYVYRNSIQMIEIGSGVTSIAGSAFYFCCSLASVTIPDSVTSIGNNAFQNCYSLANVTIPDSVTSIGSNAFQTCCSLASVTIPDSVTSIGNNAFYYCYSLANVTIPDSVTSIGSNAFNFCCSLASVTIPDSVTSIGNNAFYSCYSLANVTIPDSVTSIGTSAFNNCFGVAEYHLARTTPPTLSGTNAFTGISADCIIYVPYSADHSILNAYKTATNWSTYASYMREEAA